MGEARSRTTGLDEAGVRCIEEIAHEVLTKKWIQGADDPSQFEAWAKEIATSARARLSEVAPRAIDVASALCVVGPHAWQRKDPAPPKPAKPAAVFRREVLRLARGSVITREALAEAFGRARYERVEMVVKVGQWAARGAIVDVFSTGHAGPVRLEFFGDKVELLRRFDPTSQRSEDDLPEAVLIPLGGGADRAAARKAPKAVPAPPTAVPEVPVPPTAERLAEDLALIEEIVCLAAEVAEAQERLVPSAERSPLDFDVVVGRGVGWWSGQGEPWPRAVDWVERYVQAAVENCSRRLEHLMKLKNHPLSTLGKRDRKRRLRGTGTIILNQLIGPGALCECWRRPVNGAWPELTPVDGPRSEPRSQRCARAHSIRSWNPVRHLEKKARWIQVPLASFIKNAVRGEGCGPGAIAQGMFFADWWLEGLRFGPAAFWVHSCRAQQDKTVYVEDSQCAVCNTPFTATDTKRVCRKPSKRDRREVEWNQLLVMEGLDGTYTPKSFRECRSCGNLFDETPFIETPFIETPEVDGEAVVVDKALAEAAADLYGAQAATCPWCRTGKGGQRPKRVWVWECEPTSPRRTRPVREEDREDLGERGLRNARPIFAAADGIKVWDDPNDVAGDDEEREE